MSPGYVEFMRRELAEQQPLYADYVRWLPDLLDYFTTLLEDQRIPQRARIWINAAVTYAVLPFDALPESAMGGFGYLDDLYVCAEALNLMLEDREIGLLVDEHWGYERACADLCQDILGQCKQALSQHDRDSARALVGLEMYSH